MEIGKQGSFREDNLEDRKKSVSALYICKAARACTVRYTVESVSIWENIKGTCLSNETFPLSQHSQQTYICMLVHIYIVHLSTYSLLVLSPSSPTSPNVSSLAAWPHFKGPSCKSHVYSIILLLQWHSGTLKFSALLKRKVNSGCDRDTKSCMRKYFLFAYFRMR